MILPILALIISLGSLAWSIGTQIKQDRQWKIINQANVQLTKTKLLFFKECTKEEINKKDFWGYKFTTYPDDSFSKFHLPSYLIAKYTSTNHPVGKFNPVFTINEAQAQLQSLGVNEPYTFFKQFKSRFQFENIGKTEAKDLSIKIQIEDPISNEWQNAFVPERNTILAVNAPIFITVGYSISAFAEDPISIKYKIEITYEDIYKKVHQKKLSLTWNKDNTWSYLND